MGLRETAERDLRFIVEDRAGFGWPVTITDPAGQSLDITGFSNDISTVIDPDTGQAVSGRSASVAFRTGTLAAAFFGLPRGIADRAAKPWMVQFNDIGGTAHRFKVAQSSPDRVLGLTVCLLEAYE